MEEINEYAIGDLITTVDYYKMLTKEKYNLAKSLQFVRNAIVHDMLPKFCICGDSYEAYLRIRGSHSIKTIVSMKIDEVNEYSIGKTSIEIWAYFLLARTRSLIEFLFQKRAAKLPPNF